jgi:hypothetical protein
MKKILLALLILFTFALSGSALSETFTWTNPTEYIDSTAIPSAKQAQIKTHIFWGTLIGGPWTEFAAVSAGATTYVGTPPPERGVMAYYTMAWELDGMQSAYLTPAVAYMRPFVACKSGSNLVIK